MTDQHNCARGFGLVIHAPFAIPGAVPMSGMHSPDIVIDWGKVEVPSDGRIDGAYCYSGDALIFTAPGIARYCSYGPHRMTIDPAPGASQAMIAALLVATALPMMLWRRGGILLHAAALCWPGQQRAIAIAGMSGSGKSTLAAALIAHGAELVADDSLWLIDGDAGLSACGLPGGLFIRSPENGTRSFVPQPHNRHSTSAQLTALLVLDREQAGNPAIRRSKPAEAIIHWLRHRHRPRIPAILRQETDVFTQCALHCREIPTYVAVSSAGKGAGPHRDIAQFVQDLLRSGRASYDGTNVAADG
jgi:hypothetical protein